MNIPNKKWRLSTLARSVEPAEIADEMRDFAILNNTSIRAIFYLLRAFDEQISRGIEWDLEGLESEDAAAARFASSIYKRGNIQSGSHKSPEVFYEKFYSESVFTICDAQLFNLHSSAFARKPDVLIESSEFNKSIETINNILRLGPQSSKSWQVIGGGIVLDVGLFAADLLQKDATLIPTTFLSMIDVAIGGKCGVNYFGKNQLGRFARPKKIIIDDSFLDSLPIQEVRAGCAEAIKHALIVGDLSLAKTISMASHLGDLKIIKSFLEKLIQIKQQIVDIDPYDTGPRQILNFGHTVAHAIETVFKESKISHGEAVAMGILIESFFAFKLNFLTEKDFIDISEILKNSKIISNLAIESVFLSKKLILSSMLSDKKNRDTETIAFAIPVGPGFYFNIKNPVTYLKISLVEGYFEENIQWK